MERKPWISRILIVLISGILMVYACMNISLPKGPRPRMVTKINRILLTKGAETFLTGFSYVENGGGESLKDWVAATAMELIPLGTYIEGKAGSHTDVEDRETYQMILASQANDENMVDENGKLVTKDGQEEEVAQTMGPQIDTSMEKLMNYEYLLGNF